MLSRLGCVSLLIILSNVMGLVSSDPDYMDQSCHDSKVSNTLIVGCLSSLVFCFIGILPAFFIRTDVDEEKFSKIDFKFFFNVQEDE